MAHEVFISHSSKDKPFADAVCAGLESRGVRCWIAPRDVLPGISWSEAIVDAVNECSVFLLILTSNSNSSKQTINEVDIAVNHNKTIVPFRMEDFQPTGSMEYFLGNLHWLDALSPGLEEHITKLVDYVLKILEVNKSKDQKAAGLAPAGEVVLDNSLPEGKKIISNPPVKKQKTGLLKIFGAAAGLVVLAVIAAFVLLNQKQPIAQASVETPTVLATAAVLFLPPTETASPEPTVQQALQETAIPVVVEASPTATATPGVGTTQTSGKDGMTQMYVPAGTFTMGSDLGQSDESPVHQVVLSAYWIDKTEVTNAMFAQCVRDQVCKKPLISASAGRANYYISAEFADYPVIGITFDAAKTYCEWAGRRLPTEAEWEKAARGLEANNYPWGNTNPSCSVTNFSTCVGDTEKVGSYANGASAFGALDMAGNVFEWVSDLYQQTYYETGPLVNPVGPEEGSYQIARGGAWNSNDNFLRSSNRTMMAANNNSNNVGFRCAQNEE
jgi:formylglycine-generating enzyme required for sulfatase activity